MLKRADDAQAWEPNRGPVEDGGGGGVGRLAAHPAPTAQRQFIESCALISAPERNRSLSQLSRNPMQIYSFWEWVLFVSCLGSVAFALLLAGVALYTSPIVSNALALLRS